MNKRNKIIIGLGFLVFLPLSLSADKPDLYIKILSYVGTPKVGKQIKILIRLENKKNSQRCPRTKMQLRIAGEDEPIVYGIPELDPGQSRTYRCKAKPVSYGRVNWTIKVDAANIIWESSDSNNTKKISFDISKN